MGGGGLLNREAVRKADRMKKQSEYETNKAEYEKRVAAREAKRLSAVGVKPWERRRPSDVSDNDSEISDSGITWCSALSASTTSTLALSEDEEKEARKMERKLRDIARLEARQAQGEVLDKLQLAKIGSRSQIESNVVMLKVRANAVRPALA